MLYALIDENRRVAALQDLASADMWFHPDGMEVVEADGFDYDGVHDLADYAYADGAFTLIEPPPGPLEPVEAAALMMQAAQGSPIPDSKAARMAPYLPVFDATHAYWEGELCVRSGKVCRKTAYGWRELG